MQTARGLRRSWAIQTKPGDDADRARSEEELGNPD